MCERVFVNERRADMTQATQLRELLAQTETLRARFEQHSPTSARYGILTKDCASLRVALAQAEARA